MSRRRVANARGHDGDVPVPGGGLLRAALSVARRSTFHRGCHWGTTGEG